MRPVTNQAADVFCSHCLPMLWDVAEPGDAGGFEGGGGVEAASDGAVDDGLFLLVEQRDHLPLRPDRPLQPPVRVADEAHDGFLLFGWRLYRLNAPKVIGIKAKATFHHTR